MTSCSFPFHFGAADGPTSATSRGAKLKEVVKTSAVRGHRLCMDSTSTYSPHSCSAHKIGRSLRSFARLIPSGSWPFKILSTISGASDVSRRKRPTYVRSTPLAAARSSRPAYSPDSSCSCQRYALTKAETSEPLVSRSGATWPLSPGVRCNARSFHCLVFLTSMRHCQLL